MGQALGQVLLILHIHLPGNHDPLSLGRASAVEAFCAVAHSGSSQRQILNKAQNSQAVLCGNAVHTLEIFLDIGTNFLIFESFSEGAVTIRPPAMSSARRTIS